MAKSLTVPFTADFGVVINVTLDSCDASSLLPTMREYGRMGWTAISLKKKGHRFPFDNEPDFDWDLFGAKFATLKNPQDNNAEEPGVWWRGQFYKRRMLEENKKFKMPKCIKYSRASNGQDPAEVVEGGTGDEIGYVTLAIFSGGQRSDRWVKSNNNGARMSDANQYSGPSKGDLCTQLSKLGTVSEISAAYGKKSFQDMNIEELQDALEHQSWLTTASEI